MKTIVSMLIALPCMLGAIPAMAALRQVYGTLTYEDALPGGTSLGSKPIRNVSVILTTRDGSDVQVVGSATTSSTGAFSTWVDQSKLLPQSTLNVELLAKNYASDVFLDLDWENDRLSFSGSTIIDNGTSPIELSYSVPVSQFSQHFSILDAIQYGREYADQRREGSDDIGRVDVQYPDADWTNYNPFWGEITIAGASAYGYGGNVTDHGWSDGTVLHEFGHHLEDEISDTDTGGGSHSWCTDNGYGFAWSEGWATYFASTVRASTAPGRLYGGFHNLEPTPSCATYGTESFTQSALWDLFDGPGGITEPFDRIDGARLSGATPIRDVLFYVFDHDQDDSSFLGLSDPQTSIKSFHDHIVDRNLYPGAHADIDRIFAVHGGLPHALSDYAVPSIGASPSGPVIAGRAVNLAMAVSNWGGVAYAEELLAVRVTMNRGFGDEVLAAFTTPSFTGTKTISRSITMPSLLSQQTYNVVVTVDPADRFPETLENNNARTIAIPVVVCGNSTCSTGESCSTCAVDCGSCCGNGVCVGSETCASCAADCGACTGCGDGWCIGNENTTCPEDCETEPACFIAGTRIAMSGGTEKAIEDVRVGDLVVSYDPEHGTFVEGEVTETFVHLETQGLVAVNGELITTPEHRFFVDGRWVAAADLNVGSSLVGLVPSFEQDVSAIGVQQVESRAGRATTYNFEVARWHNYFAGGLLVHNIKNQPPP